MECVLREVQEEFGMTLLPTCVHWTRAYSSSNDSGSYFMVGTLTPSDAKAIQFGSEGQQWTWMSVEEFLSHEDAVPRLQERLRDYLASQ